MFTITKISPQHQGLWGYVQKRPPLKYVASQHVFASNMMDIDMTFDRPTFVFKDVYERIIIYVFICDKQCKEYSLSKTKFYEL